ncbi:MAG TPA: CtsR family transcriptional regulator [Facklamia tabacinasalis]|uniref:Transcriptional regulator CtsR n=1 Tax=Ruoffia tabacinasalis TaxID=87458 RepID=A0A5R9DU55_9LACT|nr:CtsR family transcriptional regulator [Ruoffia tabacinasalis]TLQ39807.1 CtsR family transcriptional regulator [Ruoffia tabacinasalis]HJG47503.1 CtsR family transcriptional regulator [Ruoffia tabacinasalis]
MAQRNMSDIIEAYLKSFLKNSERIEIKRSDIAEQFDCVPSQINYVINTRFTQEHGYMVESKRGGGGYIRILKVELVDEIDALDDMIQMIGTRINHRSANNIIETLVNHSIMTEREGALILSVIDKALLQTISLHEQEARALILSKFLEQLRITYK